VATATIAKMATVESGCVFLVGVFVDDIGVPLRQAVRVSVECRAAAGVPAA
jgi:hypothetical protein